MITSTANAKIKRLINLQKKRKARAQEGVFLVEGIRMAKEAPGEKIRELYAAESFDRHCHDEVEEIAEKSGIRPEILTDAVFAHVSDTKTPQGILLVMERTHYTEEDLYGDGEKALILILENLQDPGNLGTLLRSAETAGVTGVLLSEGSVDVYSPKVVRSTMGSLFRVPFLYVDDLIAAMRNLQTRGTRIYAASLDGAAAYDEEAYDGDTAFLIGNEGSGLSKEAASSADAGIYIPMEGEAESLNAAIAGSILLFEAARQRRRQ